MKDDGTNSTTRSFDIKDTTDLEGRPLSISDVGREKVIIQKHEFVGSNWQSFKAHIIRFLSVELELMRDYRNWIYILVGFVIIYLHVTAHNLAYYLASPSEPLHDILYTVIPEISENSPLFAMNSYMLLFMFTFIAATGFSLLVVRYPNVLRRTALGYINRFFVVINVTQPLRIITFLVTQVPAPNPNCRALSFNPPKTLADILNQNAGAGDRGCGDLIFSSHAMFGLLIVLMHVKYLGLSKYERIEGKTDITDKPQQQFQHINSQRQPAVIVVISRKQYLLRLAVIWFVALCFIIDLYLIIASRKHYTVDIVVSLYTTYMVWYIMEQKYADPEIPIKFSDN